MKVSELMNKYPVTILPETTLQDVVRFFFKHDISAISVVDSDGKLLGIVSEGDLLYKKVRPHVPRYVNILGASIFYGGMGEYNESFSKLLASSVDELMTREVVYGSPDDDVEDLATIMVEQHLKMVPVVKDGRVVGTLSRHDIMRLIAQEEHLD